MTFGIHPLQNPQRLEAAYQPLIVYLNQRLEGPQIRLVASRDYGEFDRRLGQGDFDIALPNPLQTLEAEQHGYSVFAKVADDDQFRGLIIVRKDSQLDELRKLRKRVISYPAPSALAGTLLPQYFLQTNGVPVSQTVTRYVGSHESAILSVLRADADAAATWPVPWEAFSRESPHEAVQLVVGWQTPSLTNNGVVAHSRVAAAVVRRLRALLTRLSADNEGHYLLPLIGGSGFAAADSTAYRPVTAFLKDYERTFGTREGAPESRR